MHYTLTVSTQSKVPLNSPPLRVPGLQPLAFMPGSQHILSLPSPVASEIAITFLAPVKTFGNSTDLVKEGFGKQPMPQLSQALVVQVQVVGHLQVQVQGQEQARSQVLVLGV